MTLSLTLAVMLGAAGAAIDYQRLVSARDDLQSAADGAALAAAAVVATGNPEKGEATFNSYLDQNIDRARLSGANVTSTYLLSNNTQVAGTISASIDSTFMSLFGYPQLPFTVHTVAEIGGSYADIHFLIDTSGSMGIPESAAGVSKLKSAFDPYGTGGCSFACHSAGTNNTGLYSGKTGYAFAQQYGIYLREDRLRDSLMAMLEKIAAVPAASNIRISLDTISGTTPKALVQNVDLPTAREAIKALTFPGSATDIDGVLDLYAGQFTQPGTGTAADPTKIVVIVTDGVSHQNAVDNPETLDNVGCDSLKGIGIQPYVLNITYPDKTAVIGDPAKLKRYATAIAAAPTALAACAGVDRYFDAYQGQEIADALATIADQLAPRQTARLTR